MLARSWYEQRPVFKMKGPSMFDAVIFDMDGTLFDSEPIWTKAWEPALKLHGFAEVPAGLPDANRGTTGTRQFEIIRQFLGSDVDAEAISRDFQQIAIESMIQNGVPTKPGVNEILDYLDEQHVPMAIASSSPMNLIESDLAHAGLTGRFKKLVSGNKLPHPKPAPDVFLLAADQLGVAPTRALVVEDSSNGIEAAHAGGFPSVLVPDMIAPSPEVQRLPLAVCHDLIEVRDLLASGKLG